MTKNPFLNALAAAVYIVLVVSLIQYGSHIFENKPDTIFIPMAMLSLFVLSAGLMGYLFLSQPIQLYADGNKKHAVTLFLQTLGVFAGITVLAFLVIFTGII